MRVLVPAVALLVIAFVGAPASAARYRIVVGGLPSITVGDAESYAARLEAHPGARSAFTGTASAPAAASPSPAALPLLPRPAEPAAARQTRPVATWPSSGACQGGETMVDLDESGPSGPPSASFRATLSRGYQVTDPVEVEAAWSWFQREPASLSDDERTGNAVVRLITALGRAPKGATDTRAGAPVPGAVRVTVRSAPGGAVRASPWGRLTGTTVAPGTVLEAVPPAHGPWYRVRTAGGEGWVARPWLDLE